VAIGDPPQRISTVLDALQPRGRDPVLMFPGFDASLRFQSLSLPIVGSLAAATLCRVVALPRAKGASHWSEAA
jgi:hypothetical protein